MTGTQKCRIKVFFQILKKEHRQNVGCIIELCGLDPQVIPAITNALSGGHLPGSSIFSAWKNAMSLLEKFQENMYGLFSVYAKKSCQ